MQKPVAPLRHRLAVGVGAAALIFEGGSYWNAD